MKKAIYALCCAFVLLVLAEVLLQVRAHFRSGQSVFNAVSGESTYQFNEALGIKLLRPSSVISGSKSTIETNSFGLRGPEISKEKQPNEVRLAIVGGSTVMGAYTKKNSNTLSYRLEHHLQEKFPDKKITVINGGIAGYTLDEQLLLMQKLLSQMDIDYYVLYSGFNDIKKYCRSRTAAEKALAEKWTLPQLTLPKWLLTVELITKNTVMLRNTPAGNADCIDPYSVDMSDYKDSLEKLIGWVADKGLPMVVMTNVRSFRQDMPLDLQLQLSETARYYNECFDLSGLHVIYDRHNELIQDVSNRYGLSSYNLMEQLPGGERYFGDATHFSVEGADVVAVFLSKILHQEIKRILN